MNIRKLVSLLIALSVVLFAANGFADVKDKLGACADAAKKDLAEAAKDPKLKEEGKAAAKQAYGDFKQMWKACKAFRGCKKKCRKAKRSCKKSGRQTKRSCIKSCKSKKGRAKRRCKRSCRKKFRGTRRGCRHAKRNCKKECKRAEEFAGCRKARKNFWRNVGKAIAKTAKRVGNQVMNSCKDEFSK